MGFKNLLTIYFLIGAFVGPQIVAADVDSCLKTLMAKPYCVSRANAARVCSTHGSSDEGLAGIVKCMADYSSFYKSGAVRGIQGVCLSGFTETGIPEEDKPSC